MKKIEVGAVVAFNKLKDTAWFDVLMVDGFNIIVREQGETYDGETYHSQHTDISLVKQVK